MNLYEKRDIRNKEIEQCRSILNIKMMTEEEKIKFQSKAEIAHAIQVLTPFALADVPQEWAIEKAKELSKLL